MGIADFFLGKKEQDVPSFNDLRNQSQRSIPNIFGPGFSITQSQTAGGRPQTRIREGAQIRQSRIGQQTASAGLARQLQSVLGGQDFSRIAADTEAGDEVERALFERGFGLLEPQREQRRERTLQGLADRGLPAGSAARREQLELLGQQEQEELNDLALRAILARDQTLTSDVNRQLGVRQQETQQLNNFIAQIQQLLAPQTGVPLGGPGPTLSGGDILAPSAQQGAFNAQRTAGGQNLLAGLLSGGARVGGAFAGRPPAS